MLVLKFNQQRKKERSNYKLMKKIITVIVQHFKHNMRCTRKMRHNPQLITYYLVV